MNNDSIVIMSMLQDAELQKGLAACEAGRFAEAFANLRPLAEAGDAAMLSMVGFLAAYAFHRFVDDAAMAAHDAWSVTASQDDLRADHEQWRADREMGLRWLRAASDQGNGAASDHLAVLALTGDGGWEERRRKASELFRKAAMQGFWMYVGEHASDGDKYLDSIERYCYNKGIPNLGDEG